MAKRSSTSELTVPGFLLDKGIGAGNMFYHRLMGDMYIGWLGESPSRPIGARAGKIGSARAIFI